MLAGPHCTHMGACTLMNETRMETESSINVSAYRDATPEISWYLFGANTVNCWSPGSIINAALRNERQPVIATQPR